MKELSEVRKEINAIDDELVKLFVRRLEVVKDVTEAKRASGTPVYDPAREREILSTVAQKVGPEYENGALLFFTTLFNISKARQREVLATGSRLEREIEQARRETPPKFPTRAVVACQGTEGAYSQQAACRLFTVPTIAYFTGFEDVFSAVEKGMCPYGVLPIENSSAGSVTPVYDLMVKHDFKIVRSTRLRIRHVLLARPGTKLEDIREVVSHPQGLAQCGAFLKKHRDWKTCPASNTAVSARMVASSGRGDMAAIASRECAELYGLDVLAENISDVPMNYTRFICISKKLEIYPDAKKISIMLTLPHRPGVLYNVMAKFAAIRVNLTKLESRPIPGMDFEFRFTLDLEASPSDPHVIRLLAELASDPDIEQFEFLGAFSEC